MGKKENSVIGLQHHVGNLRKYEKWLKKKRHVKRDCNSVFSQKSSISCRFLTLPANFWVRSGCTNIPCQRGYIQSWRAAFCPRVVDSSSFSLVGAKTLGISFSKKSSRNSSAVYLLVVTILLMCLFVRTDSRRLKFCPAARFLHLLALYVIVNDMPCEKERTSLYIVYACAEVYLFLFYIKIHACDKRFVSEKNIF